MNDISDENEPLDRTIKNPVTWSGKTSFSRHKSNDTPDPPWVQKGFRKVWYLDAQWSDCPVEVEDEIQQMWRDYELGNDRYMIKTTIGDLLESYEIVAQYVLEQCPDIGDEELIVIHWWW